MRNTLMFLGIVAALVGLSVAGVGCSSKMPAEAGDASANGAETKWGGAANGFQTRLIATSDVYKVGQPMHFDLLLKNVSKKTKQYDDQGVVKNTLLIRGPGKEPYYKEMIYQTAGNDEPIAAGQTKILFKSRDLTEEYVFLAAGEYTVQFRGEEGRLERLGRFAGSGSFPASNVVTIQIQPGKIRDEDRLISLLNPVPPTGRWRVSRGWAVTEGKVTPVGRSEVDGTKVNLVHRPESGLIRDLRIIQVWITRETTTKAPPAPVATTKKILISEYLGKGELGHCYIAAREDGYQHWPNAKADLKRALKIR